MNNLTVAKTILEQLGGNKFIMMTGAKNFIGSETTLSFKIGKNSKSINGVYIKLDPSDTYSIEFLRVSVKGRKVVSSFSGIYFDSLQSIFTRETGMETRL